MPKAYMAFGKKYLVYGLTQTFKRKSLCTHEFLNTCIWSRKKQHAQQQCEVLLKVFYTFKVQLSKMSHRLRIKENSLVSFYFKMCL